MNGLFSSERRKGSEQFNAEIEQLGFQFKDEIEKLPKDRITQYFLITYRGGIAQLSFVDGDDLSSELRKAITEAFQRNY